MKITISVIKADVGSYPGHCQVHPDLMVKANSILDEYKKSGQVIDFMVTHAGDDLELIMTHNKGINNKEIHELSWSIFKECTEVAKGLKLYGAGQDMLSDAFSGNIKGMGPGVAEMEIEERKSEPILIFMADKTEPGAWNYILYKMFADPFNTPGLVISGAMHQGFVFEVHDLIENKKIELSAPEELYDLLALIGTPSRYVIKRVYAKNNEIGAVTSTDKLSLIAGKYVGKDDPVMIIRAQGLFPAVGECLEPFSNAHLVAGGMRGSHIMPLMPVSEKDNHPTRFDGPPRVIGLGFQLNNGKLGKAADLFNDVSFDSARKRANLMTNYMRTHGPFMPHRLPPEEMEYTTLPEVLEKLKERFQKIE